MGKSWLKYRRYGHFSPKFSSKIKEHKGFIINYVRNRVSVKKHRFFPFIHYEKIDSKKKWVVSKNGTKKLNWIPLEDLKKRQIFYANHLDSQVFAYYSYLINSRLNKLYDFNPDLDSAVTAYRSYNRTQPEKQGKSNIHYAKEVFDFIKNYKASKLSVVCLDISSYFDSINHKVLKQQWAKLYNKTSLPDDHYAVFKAITKFNYVDLDDLLAEFRELRIKNRAQLRYKDLDCFCKSMKDYRERVVNKGLVKTDPYGEGPRKRTKGIPQGSPISSVLSNLYLYDFDKTFSSLLPELDGLYRRYSDDIIFMCDPAHESNIKDLMYSILEGSKYQLEIKKAKEQILKLTRNEGDTSNHRTIIDSDSCKLATLDYLGFCFDGRRVLLRQKGLSKYYRKAKATVHRRAFYASIAKRKNAKIIDSSKKFDDWIYRRGIYRTKTHLGAKRKSKVSYKPKRGNYISYAYRAARIMGEKSLRSQVSRHWKIIEDLIANEEKEKGLRKQRRNNG